MNMSYCRFENTLQDLRDCEEHLDEQVHNLSEDEQKAREKLVKLCKRIGEEYGDYYGD